MRRMPFFVLAILLPLPWSVLAAPTVQSVPEWRIGDTWQYRVETRSDAGITYGNLTIRVVADGGVRIGNATVRAYTLSQRLAPWVPVNATNSRLGEEARWGDAYTVVTTTLIIDKRTLGTMVSNSTIRSVHGAQVTEDRELLTYSPSDGRLRFPLSPGVGWNATFNLTRIRQLLYHTLADNSTQTRRYECESYESVTYKEKGFRVRCTTDGGVAETVFWYSTRYRADVRREEHDPSLGTVRTYTLVGFEPGAAPSMFSSPQTVLAMFFGIVAAAMLAGAIIVRFLPGPLARYREEYRRKHPLPEPGPERKATPPPPHRPAAATRGRPPAAPAPAARTGPGRSL